MEFRLRLGDLSIVGFSKKIPLFIAIFAIFSQSSQAQDANYWTHQYGTRATLLGGAVIGSVLDLSGTFYNPGGLALIEKPDILLAAKVFQYPHYLLRGIDRSTQYPTFSRLTQAPSLLAGSLPFKWLGKNHFLGYSALTRYDIRMNIAQTTVITATDVPIPGNTVSGLVDLRLYEELSEPWYGVTWSYRYKKKIGLGISHYASFRNHSALRQTLTEVVSADGQIYLNLQSNEYKYDFYGLIWKLGATFEFIGLDLGLTITTPTVKLYGTGQAGLNKTRIVPNQDGQDNKDSQAILNFQDNLNVEFHTPLSIAFGTTLKYKLMKIYFSTEWFSSVDKYDVIKTKPFVSANGDTLRNELTHALKAVWNFSLGYEYFFSPRFSAKGSFTTDFSATKPRTGTTLSIATWDIYHFMGGTTFQIRKTELTLGLGYSYGKKILNVDIDPGTDDEPGIDFIYSSFKFLFGFSF